MHLAELVWPDHKKLQDYRKIILRNSVRVNQNLFEFFLPGHKADRFFEGNKVIIQATQCDDNPLSPFITYLCVRDQHFPFRPELWLREDGSIPTRSWFIRHLHHHFASDVGGHSMRAGGATALAEAGIPSHDPSYRPLEFRSFSDIHPAPSHLARFSSFWPPFS